ncbi:MAG: M48 family metallopeptidase, partial [Nitrospinota bacterium]
TFSPLPEGDLKNALLGLAEETGFSFKDVKIMDASKRSNHSNAYFTGFGKVKRVVLFDTLVSSMTTDELVSVLAHELGHFKKRHILKTLILSQTSLLVGFMVMGFFKDLPWLYSGLGLNENSWSVLICFGLIIPRVTFWFSPLMGLFSRNNEFEADFFAKKITGTGDHLKSALICLEKENLNSPEPYPLFQKWHYSHPTVGQRVEALEAGQK